MADATPLPATTPETATLHSFDGGYRETVEFCRPDRYRAVEAAAREGRVIARGGGYSYAAASFGGGSRVVDMTRLDRVLRFEPAQRLVEVEAGMRLEQLLALTAPRGLILPVQPGYPAITVGGCVAANVHGKNPQREGAFRHSVVDLTLIHPRLGMLRIDRQTEPVLFDLTCGGYGLTGIIMAATLRLEPLAGWTASVERVPIETLAEGLALVRERTESAAFAYTWHEGAPAAGVFGRGFVYVGTASRGPSAARRAGASLPTTQRFESLAPRSDGLGQDDQPTARRVVPCPRGLAARAHRDAALRRAVPLCEARRVLLALRTSRSCRVPVARAARGRPGLPAEPRAGGAACPRPRSSWPR